MNQSTETLRVGITLARSVVTGPGERFVIWAQGCPFDCPGCWNQELRAFGGKSTRMSIDELWSQISAENKQSTLDGITFSGGEPFAQALPLSRLARKVHQSQMSVVAFSGYTHAELERSPDPNKQDLLAEIDLLVSGKYDQSQRNPSPTDMRGSLNQEVLYLTGRIHPPALPLPPAELHINEDGTVTVSGFPSGDLRKALESVCK